MATRHTYASADDLREYLSGTSYSSGWTSDGAALRLILEAESRRIDDFCGGGAFGPLTESRYYDIGRGNLRHSSQPSVYGTPTGEIGNTQQLVNSIPLDGWLISTSAVTAYGQTARTDNTSLSEGYGGDYWLLPYNSNPKTIFQMNEDTSNSLSAGQQTLLIAGQWGYSSDTISVTTADAISSTTATSVSVTSGTDLSPAQTILIDSEQMYITAISGNTLTLERGVNGTSGATHSGGATVYRYDYEPLIAQACKDLAKIVFRDRDLGRVDAIGGEGVDITRSSREAVQTLNTLNAYRVAATSNGIVF